jgi:hypothetical protein
MVRNLAGCCITTRPVEGTLRWRYLRKVPLPPDGADRGAGAEKDGAELLGADIMGADGAGRETDGALKLGAELDGREKTGAE